MSQKDIFLWYSSQSDNSRTALIVQKRVRSKVENEIPQDFVSKIVAFSFQPRQKCQTEYGAFKASSSYGIDSSLFDTNYVIKQRQKE